MNTDLQEQIDQALRFDPLAALEQATGRSYKEDESLVWASMGLQQKLGAHKEELLKLNDDTYWGITIPEVKRLLARLGFELLLEDAIPSKEDGAESGNFYRLYWHHDGLLISFDSYWGDKSINGGKVHMFLNVSNRETAWDALSGCSHDGFSGDGNVIHVDYDIREGLRHKIESLRQAGSFVQQWPLQPFLWLLHYMDSKPKGYDYKAITAARIKRLPETVQKFICA